jgi:hypothetical protein
MKATDILWVAGISIAAVAVVASTVGLSTLDFS